MFIGGFGSLSGGGDPNNTCTAELETYPNEQTAPRSTAADCEQKSVADVDRKSRDFVGDDDVTQSPRESLSLQSVCSVS